MKKISLILKSLRCHIAIAPLLLRCCRSCCRYAVTPAIASSVDPLSIRCHSAVAPLSFSCHSTVAQLPLLFLRSRCYCFCCRCAVTTDIAPAVTPLSLLLSLCCLYGVALVLLQYCSVISPPSLRCCSAADAFTAAVALAIAPAVTPLLLLVLLTVVASRVRIRVTVSIGDCQARVSSSSEGCSTS